MYICDVYVIMSCLSQSEYQELQQLITFIYTVDHFAGCVGYHTAEQQSTLADGSV